MFVSLASERTWATFLLNFSGLAAAFGVFVVWIDYLSRKK